MKYVKHTDTERRPPRRWYNDACGTAFALELVGERWALLVIRELLFGPRRFNELRAGLPGITAKVLTERLEGLEAAGVLSRRKLPSPASAQVYELTPWGYRSERAIQELGRWATQSPDHDPTLPLSSAAFMSSLRTMFAADLASGMDATFGILLGEDAFVAKVDSDGFTVRRGEPDAADVTFISTPHAMAALIYGGQPLNIAEANESVRVEGDRSLAKRFTTLFPLPTNGA